MRWSSTATYYAPNNAVLVVAGDVKPRRCPRAGRDALRPVEADGGSAAAPAADRAAATGRAPAGDGRCARVAALCRADLSGARAQERDTAEGCRTDRSGGIAGRQRHDVGSGARAAPSTIRRRCMSRPTTTASRWTVAPSAWSSCPSPASRLDDAEAAMDAVVAQVPDGRRRSGGAGADQDADARLADLRPRQCRGLAHRYGEALTIGLDRRRTCRPGPTCCRR